MDESSELASRAFNDNFPKVPERSPSKVRTYNHNSNEISKVNKKSLFQLLCISISKITMCPSGNVKNFPKRSLNYKIINNHPFSNTLYRITKIHITIEESTLSSSNNVLCINIINLSTTLGGNGEDFIQRDIAIKDLKKKF